MAKLTLDPISSMTQAAVGTINNNFDKIEAAVENTLSRDGSTPNQMNADIDMNGNDILNVGSISADSITVGGADISLGRWHVGTGIPSPSLGVDGDLYLREETGQIYGPKTSGSWGLPQADISGPQGPQGPQGPVGQTGPQGPQGTSWAPDAIGPISGRADYDDEPQGFSYLDIDNGLLYFKRSVASGDWSAGVTFQQGPQGVPGAAATISVGTVTTGDPGDPASVTNVGTANAAVFDFVIPRGQDGTGAGATTIDTLADLKDAPVNLSFVYLMEEGLEGWFAWKTGDYTGQADDLLIVESDHEDISIGAWVRRPVYWKPEETEALTNVGEFQGRVYSPFQFGAKGNDPNHDDGPAFNAMFDQVRADQIFGSANAIPKRVDLSGAIWYVQTSINATNLASWGLEITGGYIVGKCAGKAVFDLTNSRGFVMRSVHVYGDETDRPTTGFQLARGAAPASGYCDNNMFDDCATSGYFSRAAVQAYAHETTTHLHCTYFNSALEGFVCIFEGYDAHTYTSDYVAPITGPTSMVNNVLINCDMRRVISQAEGLRAQVTGITKGATTTVTVTNPGTLKVGDQVTFQYVGGLPALSRTRSQITNISGNTITTNLNSSGISGSFTSGGWILKMSNNPTMYIARTSDFRMIGCYIVAYSSRAIDVGFPDTTYPLMNHLDIQCLFEGSGLATCVRFLTGNQPCTVYGFKLDTYHAPYSDALVNIAQEGPSATVGFYDVDIKNMRPQTGASRPLLIPTANAFIRGGTVTSPGNLGQLGSPSSWIDLRCRVNEIDVGGGTYRVVDIGTSHYGTLRWDSVETNSTAGSLLTYMTVQINGNNYKVPIYKYS